MTRRFQTYLPGLLILGLWAVLPAPAAAQEAAAEEIGLCAAETPVMNPWTRKKPAGWWLKRHEAILALPGRNEVQIAFIGDSITDGWDNAGLKVWEKEYVPLKPLNLGIDCDSTQHVLWRLDHGEMDNLPKLKVVVIEIGTNNQGITRDPPEDIAKGVEAICGRVKQKAPQAKILIMAIFPKRFGAIKHDVANGLIAKLADDKQIFYMDINEALVTGKGFADWVGHLNETGFQIWADQVRPLIEKLMKD